MAECRKDRYSEFEITGLWALHASGHESFPQRQAMYASTCARALGAGLTCSANGELVADRDGEVDQGLDVVRLAAEVDDAGT
jgi:hypothetical protein